MKLYKATVEFEFVFAAEEEGLEFAAEDAAREAIRDISVWDHVWLGGSYHVDCTT